MTPLWGSHRKRFWTRSGKEDSSSGSEGCMTALTSVKFCQPYHQPMICFWLVNFLQHDLIAESKHGKFSRSAQSLQTFRSLDQHLETADLIHLLSWWLTNGLFLFQTCLMNSVWAVWEVSSIKTFLFTAVQRIWFRWHQKSVSFSGDHKAWHLPDWLNMEILPSVWVKMEISLHYSYV